MGSDYFSLVQPWYFWTTIPDETGYHVYSFALDPEAMDPTGSTNFGKLTNVSLVLTPSADAVAANDPAPETGVQQTFQVLIRALNFNIVRISGGAKNLRRKILRQQNIGSFAGKTLVHQSRLAGISPVELAVC